MVKHCDLVVRPNRLESLIAGITNRRVVAEFLRAICLVWHKCGLPMGLNFDGIRLVELAPKTGLALSPGRCSADVALCNISLAHGSGAGNT